MFNNIKKLRELKKQMKSFDFENLDSEMTKQMMKEMGLDEDFLEKQTNELFKFKHRLKFTKIHPDAVEPKYNYETDSGFDLHSIEEVEIAPFGRKLIRTGLKFSIPNGCEIQVRPKSGLALKQGLTVLNTPGTVDQGYTGEIMVIVFNANAVSFKIEKGMKIAQAVLCPVYNGKMVDLHQVIEIDEKDRGDKGFGSTGIK